MPVKPASPDVQRGNPLNHGLAGAWLLTEGAGTTSRDSSGPSTGSGGNSLSLVSTSWKAGRAGRCLGFDGNVSYAVTSKNVSVGSAFTIAVWVNPSGSMSSYPRIVEADYNDAFFLGLDGAATAFDFIVSGWNLGGCVGGTPTIGLWQHVCGVFDNGNGYLYVNGQQVSSYTGSVPSWTGPLYVGRPIPRYGGTYWDGLIDDVRYLDSALTPRQVGALYRSTYDEFRPRPPANGFFSVAGGSTLALAARGAAMTKGLPGANCLAPLNARAAAAGTARVTAGYAAVLSAVSAGMARAQAGISAVAALSARSGAASRTIGTIGTGTLLALSAVMRGAGMARAAASYAAALSGRTNSAGSSRSATSARAALTARGAARSVAAATMLAGARLAVAARALAIGSARAVLSLVTSAPAPSINPTIEIVSTRPPGMSITGQKNVLTLTTTNQGPLKG